MGIKTTIRWCDSTFSPWVGCQAVSPGCDHCYAETLAKRYGPSFGVWGPNTERRRTSHEAWLGVKRWNRIAGERGRPATIFPSLCDPFDNAVPTQLRDAFWRLIRDTPNLIWMLLTKRPQNFGQLPEDWGDGWPNVWLGVSVENQLEASRRIPILARTPAALRFISAEPLLERVALDLRRISWVIVGGESGPHSRPMRPEWARHILAQCAREKVKGFHKQTGSRRNGDWPPGITGKGDNPAEWPAEFQVQQHPLDDLRLPAMAAS